MGLKWTKNFIIQIVTIFGPTDKQFVINGIEVGLPPSYNLSTLAWNQHNILRRQAYHHEAHKTHHTEADKAHQ